MDVRGRLPGPVDAAEKAPKMPGQRNESSAQQFQRNTVTRQSDRAIPVVNAATTPARSRARHHAQHQMQQ